MVRFKIKDSQEEFQVFTTRPDTIFGVSFMTLAPEHELVEKITTSDQRQEVEDYVMATSKRSERDRMSDVKTISGVFTGAYAVHPFTGRRRSDLDRGLCSGELRDRCSDGRALR